MDNQTLMNTNLIDLLGLQNLPEDQKAKMVERMTQVVQDRVTNRVINVMSPEQRATMDTLLAADAAPADLDAFMKKSVPSFEEILTEEILRFKTEMKENADAVRQMVSTA